MKKIAYQLRLVAVVLLAVVMMVGMAFVSSAEETGGATSSAPDLSTITWVVEGTENAPEGLVYTGEKYTIQPTNLPDGVTLVRASGNVATNAGNYNATATVKYQLDGKEKTETVKFAWTVAKATYDMSGVSLSDGTLVYNGEAQTLSVSGELPDGVNVSYGDGFVDAGVYTVTAKFTGDKKNYEDISPMTATLTIAKATYDMSGVVFADTTVPYRGIAQSIAVSGTLPRGVRVSYDGSFSEIGTYTVVASFKGDTNNYEPIASMSATLTIVPATEEDRTFIVKDSAGRQVLKVVAADGIPADRINFVDNSYLYDTIEISDYCKVDVLTSYDIGFSFAGAVQSVSERLTVTLLIPEAIRDNDKLELVHITDDGRVEKVDFTRDGDNLVFETDHFSTYAIVEEYSVLTESKETLPWWMILLFVLDAITIIFLVVSLCLKPRDPNASKEEPTEEAPTEEEPVEEAPVEEAPVEEDPTEETPTEEAPTEEEPVEEAPVEETPAEETPAEEATVEETPAEETPVEEAPVEETPVEETPVEETPAEEAPVEETPAEEATVEETPTEEEPAEETPVEETPAEEAPAEEAPVAAPAVVSSDDDDEGTGSQIINGQVVMVRYRSSFMSRLIQAETEIQDYYTVIKNTLLSYKGVKARTSWNYESFNKGRFQCAKLNIKGRTLNLYLALAPDEYSASKYHFSDASGKGKFDKVPMMLKIRSDRALKYAIELIEELMKAHEIEAGPAQNVDYHMPYESNEALAERDLVKVIVPEGVVIGENDSLVSLDVSDVIGSAPQHERVANDEIRANLAHLREEMPDEAVVHVDAQHADELVTDDEAKAQIEIVAAPVAERRLKGTKSCEINLDTICENFEDGETVELAKLIERGLVNKNAGKIKILARGVMSKRLVVIADKYSIQAVKMITLAGGHAEQIGK